MLSLCDQDYKLNSFFLASDKDIPDLKEGTLIHLKEVTPKKIKNSTFIRIKEYEIIGEPQDLPEVKEIKMEDFPFSEKKEKSESKNFSPEKTDSKNEESRFYYFCKSNKKKRNKNFRNKE